MAERNINKDKKLDKFRLDEEVSNQASLTHYWSKRVSDFKFERDSAENDVRKAKARVTLKIMSGKYKLPTDKKGEPIKLTNPIIEAMVNLDEDVNIARELLATAEADYSDALSDEKAIRQKGFDINNLIELYTKEYYAPVNTDRRDTRSNMGSDAIAGDLNSRRNKRSQED